MNYQVTLVFPTLDRMLEVVRNLPPSVHVSSARQVATDKLTTSGNGKAKKGKVTAHAKPDTRMKMTGKVPRASELLASGLDLFERMEKEHGIGSITVEMFRNQIDANELGEGSKLQTRLKHEGYLEYLE